MEDKLVDGKRWLFNPPFKFSAVVFFFSQVEKFSSWEVSDN